MKQQVQSHVAQRYLAVLEGLELVAHFPLDTGFGQTVLALAVVSTGQLVAQTILLKTVTQNQNCLHFLAFLFLIGNLLRSEIPL
jgi:hypothetical protein